MISRAFNLAVTSAHRDRMSSMTSSKDLRSNSTRTYVGKGNGDSFGSRLKEGDDRTSCASPRIGAWRPTAKKSIVDGGYYAPGYSGGEKPWCSEGFDEDFKGHCHETKERPRSSWPPRAAVDLFREESFKGQVAASRTSSREGSIVRGGREEQSTTFQKAPSAAQLPRVEEKQTRPAQQGYHSCRGMSPQPQARGSVPHPMQQQRKQPEFQQRSQGRTFDGPYERAPSQPGRDVSTYHSRERDVPPQRRPVPAAPSVGRPQRSGLPAAGRDGEISRRRTESRLSGVTHRHDSPAQHPHSSAWDAESAAQGSTSDPSSLAWDTESAAQGSTAVQRAGSSIMQDRCPSITTRQPSPAPQRDSSAWDTESPAQGSMSAPSFGRQSITQDRGPSITTRQPSAAQHCTSALATGPAQGSTSARSSSGSTVHARHSAAITRQPSPPPQHQQQQPAFGIAGALQAPQMVVDSTDSESSLRCWAAQHSERSQQEWQELAWQLCRAELEGDTCWAEEDVKAEHEAPYLSLFERLEAAYC